jgi:hypothetical protein
MAKGLSAYAGAPTNKRISLADEFEIVHSDLAAHN